MDVAVVIRQRLDELGLEQRDLARAAHVTESYVSQLLTQKKAPPAPERTEIYDRMDRFLKFPTGELARVAEAQLKEDRKRRRPAHHAEAARPARGERGVVGMGSRQLRDYRHRCERRAQTLCVCRTQRRERRSGERAAGIPARAAAQWLGDGGGAIVSQDVAAQGPAAYGSLLLSRAPESA